MKRISSFALALICLLSCVRQELEECALPINGRWAKVDEHGWCDSYLLFEDGRCYEYRSEIICYAGGNAIWDCSEEYFKSVSCTKYAVVDGDMKFGYPDAYTVGAVNVKDSVLTIGEDSYVAISSFESTKYSEIMVSEELTTTFPHMEQDVEWDIPIKNPVSGFSLTASTSEKWIHDLRTDGTMVYFTVKEQNMDVSGKITLSYPTADDLEVFVTQTGTRAIKVTNSSLVNNTLVWMDTSMSGYINYRISNPKSGYELTASEEVGWITNVVVHSDRITFDMSRNTSKTSRSASMRLSYPEAPDVVITIKQEGWTPSLYISPSSYIVDYRSGEYSFYCYTNNTDISVEAVSLVPWITDVVKSNTDSEVSYTVAQNNERQKRTGRIKVTYDTLTQYYEVTQTYNAPEIEVHSVYDYYSSGGANYEFGYTIKNPYDGERLTVSSESPFIENLSATDGIVRFTLQPNNGSTERTGKIILRYMDVTKEVVFIQLFNSIDLSKAGSANSYIVSSAGAYKFKAVKGNSLESVAGIASCEVLWESFGTDVAPEAGDLIKSVSYSNGYVTFATGSTFKEGNAVIAAKNSNGTILWSWHIWMTDTPAVHVYPNNVGSLMDRNLGALSATPSDKHLTYGLLYQWGRKDPFPGGVSSGVAVKSTSKESWSRVDNDGYMVTVDYTVANPMTGISNEGGDFWLSTFPEPLLWSSDKTKYDPCPPGWRVCGEKSQSTGRSGSMWYRAGFSTETSTYDSENLGRSFNIGNGVYAWFPLCGLRDFRYYSYAASLSGVDYNGFYQNLSLTEGLDGCYKLSISDDAVYPYLGGSGNGAYPLRCQKE